MFEKFRHIHFVGIGGSGMSGIAEVLLKLGYRVTGSDLQKSAVVKRLEELGAVVYEGHRSENVGQSDVVVTSTAVSSKNPEVLQAKKEGIPVIPRVEMLAEIARLKYAVAVAGTHGKTTTSSLTAQILKECGLDPTVIVGGKLKAVGTGGVLGKGDYLVAEADESDGSFLKLHPTISIITNIDNDHLDYYKTEKNLIQAFIQFANNVPFYGLTLLCGDDAKVKKILSQVTRRIQTYGFEPKNDLRASDVQATTANTKFTVWLKDRKLGTVSISLPGRHNVLNALAAIGVGLNLNLSFNQIARALEQFEGVGRRLEFKGMAAGVTIWDDYGHHPTEMAATLDAIRHRWPKARLHVIFQPHRFSRTKLLFKEFGKALRDPDKVFLMPIYPAGEKPIKGVSEKIIAKEIKKKNWVLWDPEKPESQVLEGLKEGDVVLTLGAGDVWKVGEALVLQGNTVAAKIARALPGLGKRIKTEEPLSRHCTWAIGGPAEVFVEVHTLKELKTVVALCQKEAVPLFLLGWGSNVLLPDEGIRGVVIRLRGKFEEIEFDGTRVKAGAGVHLPKLARACAKNNLWGVSSLAGVPGTLGGALITNAGTRNGTIGEVLEEVDVLNRDGSVETLKKSQLTFRYRQSNLTGRWIVSALLQLSPSNNGDAWDAIKKELDYRQKTQPLGTKNVGSVFVNPPNQHAAKLIEEVGLKGRQLGQLRFSPKHANFIENLGGGTAKEAMELIQMAQRLVKKQFNVDLVPEVRFINAPAGTAF